MTAVTTTTTYRQHNTALRRFDIRLDPLEFALVLAAQGAAERETGKRPSASSIIGQLIRASAHPAIAGSQLAELAREAHRDFAQLSFDL